MALTPVTPENTPRQVIPFGDRPIVDAQGRPTPEFYQWCNRVAGGLTNTITNVSNTIVETNNVVETVNVVTTDVSTIEADIATINQEIIGLQTEINNIPTAVPAPPAPPPAALGQQMAVPPALPPVPAPQSAAAMPPPLPRWAPDFLELEAGSNPTKISAMSDLNLAGPPTGAEKLAGESGGATNLGVALTTLYELFVNWLNYIATNPLTATTAATAGLSIQFRAGDGDTTGNGGSIGIRAGAGGGSGGDTGGTITITIGTGTANGNLVVVNLPTSSAGLPANAIWCDTGAANVLKRV